MKTAAVVVVAPEVATAVRILTDIAAAPIVVMRSEATTGATTAVTTEEPTARNATTALLAVLVVALVVLLVAPALATATNALLTAAKGMKATAVLIDMVVAARTEPADMKDARTGVLLVAGTNEIDTTAPVSASLAQPVMLALLLLATVILLLAPMLAGTHTRLRQPCPFGGVSIPVMLTS